MLPILPGLSMTRRYRDRPGQGRRDEARTKRQTLGVLISETQAPLGDIYVGC